MTHTTETLDKLYLEWSQFTEAKTSREIALEKSLEEAQERERKAFKAGWMINAVGPEIHSQEYLDGCEDVDWHEYQKNCPR